MFAALFSTAQELGYPLHLDRKDLEKRISGILHKSSFVFFVKRPGPKEESFRTASFFGDALPTSEGKLISEWTADFEGCVLVQYLTRSEVLVQEERTDLSYPLTEPAAVRVQPPPPEYESLGGTSIAFPYEGSISRRLKRMYDLASDILDKAYVLFPDDVPSRLVWLSQKYESDLSDKIYLNAGEIIYHEDGVIIASPGLDGLLGRHRFHIHPDDASEFAELIHRYRSAYCAVRVVLPAPPYIDGIVGELPSKGGVA